MFYDNIRQLNSRIVCDITIQAVGTDAFDVLRRIGKRCDTNQLCTDVCTVDFDAVIVVRYFHLIVEYRCNSISFVDGRSSRLRFLLFTYAIRHCG